MRIVIWKKNPFSLVTVMSCLICTMKQVSIPAAQTQGKLYTQLLNWELLPAELPTLCHHVNGAIALILVETSPLTSESLLYCAASWWKDAVLAQNVQLMGFFFCQTAVGRCEWAQRMQKKTQRKRWKERERVIHWVKSLWQILMNYPSRLSSKFGECRIEAR